MNTSTITSKKVTAGQRVSITAQLFGVNFPMRLEPTIYAMADRLASSYNGGHWEFYSLSNGGWFMAPSSDTSYSVSCDNGYQGELSGEAFGIVCGLYGFSHLSFSGDAFAEYHLLREFMFGHPEVGDILRAID